MSQVTDKHAISLQYQVRTSRTGYRNIERLLPLMGEFQNAVIRHPRALAHLGVPSREILQHQTAGITDLRVHDPAVRQHRTAPRRVRRQARQRRLPPRLHRAERSLPTYTVTTRLPHARDLRASCPARQVPEIRRRRDPHQGLANPVVSNRPPHQRPRATTLHQDHQVQQKAHRHAGLPVPRLPTATHYAVVLRY